MISTLVAAPGAAQPLTANKETDARTAIMRGLEEYVQSTVVAEPQGGRQVKFKAVFNTWPDTMDEAQYPSAIVYSPDDKAIYDASRFAPVIDPSTQVATSPSGNTYAVPMSEFISKVTVEIRCADRFEREAFMSACEDAFNPVDYQYGFVLQLPHYFNQRAQYELLTSKYHDSEVDVTRRFRVGSFEFTAQLPLTRLFKRPLLKIRTSIQVQVGPTGVAGS